MTHRNIDTLCAIASRLIQDAATLRELGCQKAAKLLEDAERELDTHVYNGGCSARDAAEAEPGSATQH